MKAKFTRPPMLAKYQRGVKNAVARELRTKLITAVEIITATILERTPVYTGKTLVNFRWSLGSPTSGIRRPIDTGLPGTTSEMSLGEEPRRAANAAIVRQEASAIMRAIGRNPFQSIYLVNNTPYFYLVEYGSYSENSRTPPSGIMRAAESRVRRILAERLTLSEGMISISGSF